MNDKQLHEMIDACRPGDEDLNQPEMAELSSHLADDDQAAALRRQIQQADRRITEAFQEVSVPPALEERLLASCAKAKAAQQESVSSNVSDPDGVNVQDNNPVSRRDAYSTGRRRFFAIAATLSASAAIAWVVVSFWGDKDEPLTADAVLESARQFFVEKDLQPATGQPLSTAPEAFPIASRDLRVPGGTRWRRLEAFVGSGSMVAYDLTAPRARVRATLYVLRTPVTGLPNAAPSSPHKNTGGSWISAWQEEDVVYVLAVRGRGKSDYERFLKSSGSTIAVRQESNPSRTSGFLPMGGAGVTFSRRLLTSAPDGILDIVGRI